MTESEGPDMEISENETNNDTEEAGTVGLGPKTRLRRAPSQEERAAIIDGEWACSARRRARQMERDGFHW